MGVNLFQYKTPSLCFTGGNNNPHIVFFVITLFLFERHDCVIFLYWRLTRFWESNRIYIKYVFFVVGICWFQIFFVSLYRI